MYFAVQRQGVVRHFPYLVLKTSRSAHDRPLQIYTHVNVHTHMHVRDCHQLAGSLGEALKQALRLGLRLCNLLFAACTEAAQRSSTFHAVHKVS